MFKSKTMKLLRVSQFDIVLVEGEGKKDVEWPGVRSEKSFPISQFVHVLLIHTTTVLIANLIRKLTL